MADERKPDGARLDRVSMRRAFERAAGTYDSAAVLQREVGQRMAERLGIVRLDPAAILDAGCGTGENALFFAGRGCRVTGIDFLDVLPVASQVAGQAQPVMPGAFDRPAQAAARRGTPGPGHDSGVAVRICRDLQLG